MSTTTPYLGLTLYDSSGDQAVTFATFRAVWGGTASTSNFYKVDTAISSLNTRVTSLENNAGAISVPLSYISANYYEATGISGITAYNTGATIIINLDTTSAGTVTANINSLGTKSLMKIDSAGSPVNIAGTELKKNVRYLFVYDGTRWLWVSQKEREDGWLDDGNTWTYSSVDSPTGIVSVNADMTGILEKGMKHKYIQDQALTGYCSFDASSAWGVGGFTSTDTAMTYTAGKFSNAATFNGTTSKIVVTDAANLKPTGDFTVGAWIKTSNTGAGKSIFQTYSKNTNSAGFMFYITSGNVLGLLLGNNTITSDNTSITGTTTVTDGNWHYAVLTYRNNYIQIYLDGKLETSGYSVAPAYAATNYVRIGTFVTTGTDLLFMNGQIDDLYLINGYALDEKTIRDKYIASTAQGTGNISVTKNAIITNVGAYSGSATLITLYHGTDFMLVNSTISSPSYSTVKTPFGFNINPDKWSVLTTDVTNAAQSSPVSGTYYNMGSLGITIPIGKWRVYFNTLSDSVVTTTAVRVTTLSCGLSTSTSAITDFDLRTSQIQTIPILASAQARFNSSREKSLTMFAKTTYYLIQFVSCSDAPTSVAFRGDIATTVIRATCEYL